MSPLALQTLFLFALGEHAGRRAPGPTTLTVAQWWVIGTAVVFIFVVFVLGSWQSRGPARSRACNSPTRLFWSLCRAHGLPWRDRLVLWQISRCQRMADPARLFLEPQRFEAANLNTSLRQQSERIKRLGQRLFAGVDKPGPSQ